MFGKYEDGQQCQKVSHLCKGNKFCQYSNNCCLDNQMYCKGSDKALDFHFTSIPYYIVRVNFVFLVLKFSHVSMYLF